MALKTPPRMTRASRQDTKTQENVAADEFGFQGVERAEIPNWKTF